MNDPVLNFVKSAGLNGRIVDVGSFDVNGSVRSVVPHLECGIDMRPGKGVDRVMPAEDMDKHFSDLDAVTCCETMEHVRDWKRALGAIWKSLRVGGRLVFTVPTLQKGYHAHPDDFWRWNMAQVRQIFRDQKVISEKDNLGCSFGFVVEKQTDTLDMTVEPVAVKRPEQKVKRGRRR